MQCYLKHIKIEQPYNIHLISHVKGVFLHMKYVCDILVGKDYLHLKSNAQSLRSAAPKWMSIDWIHSQPKCSDLLRINSNHEHEKWLRFHSLFFFPPYHHLFPSGERFYLPAHFSNQISTWELDFFKSSPEPRSYDSGDGRGKLPAMPSFLPADWPTEKAQARSRKDEFVLPSCDHNCSVHLNHRTRADWGVKQMS